MRPARPDTCLFLAFDEVTNVKADIGIPQLQNGNAGAEFEWPQNDCSGFSNEAPPK